MTVLVTGGAGFIGSAVVRYLVAHGASVVVLDALTYAGHKSTLQEVQGCPNFTFVEGNICDTPLVIDLLKSHHVSTVMHLAAESHVDRSILDPGAFIQTNLVGTASMLTAAHTYHQTLRWSWLIGQLGSDFSERLSWSCCR